MTRHLDMLINFGPRPLGDIAAAEQMRRIDIADDQRWFENNPGQRRRVRLASERERRVYDLPRHALAVANLLDDGSQLTRYVPGPEND